MCHWILLCANVLSRYRQKKVRFDQTNILNPAVLSKRKREFYVKLGFYLLCFFFYLYKYAACCLASRDC